MESVSQERRNPKHASGQVFLHLFVRYKEDVIKDPHPVPLGDGFQPITPREVPSDESFHEILKLVVRTAQTKVFKANQLVAVVGVASVPRISSHENKFCPLVELCVRDREMGLDDPAKI
jgi:hypothetical protein